MPSAPAGVLVQKSSAHCGPGVIVGKTAALSQNITVMLLYEFTVWRYPPVVVDAKYVEGLPATVVNVGTGVPTAFTTIV